MEVIFLTGHAEFNAAIGALQEDGVNLLTKPFHIEQLRALIKRARDRRRVERENHLLYRGSAQSPAVARWVGESEPVKVVWRIIDRIAPMPSTVLIKGETGTGKELAARALHDLSGRRGCYVPVNCGAISAELIEGELFGHLKGAFTGAHQARQGLFGHADGGTLFLDEIGEMPLGMQAKLLRVLQEELPPGRRKPGYPGERPRARGDRTATWPPRFLPAASARISTTGSTSSSCTFHRRANVRAILRDWHGSS